MFLLSNLVLVLSLGTFWLWNFLQVFHTAISTPRHNTDADYLLVPGKRLQAGALDHEYKQRLFKALTLWKQKQSRTVIVLGGQTDADATSEAKAGCQYLRDNGVPLDHVLTEDASPHTLENLRCVRAILSKLGATKIALISNRYHLGRTRVFAATVGLTLTQCAAEDQRWRVKLPKLLLEAYYLHWYRVALAYSRWVGKTELEQRIT